VPSGELIRVVDAEPGHLEAVRAIYAHEVEHGAITFDLDVPSLERWQGQLAGLDRSRGHEFLVAVDEREEVLGYAKSGPWRDKGAYATTAETSIYVHREARGRGVGSALYTELVARAERGPLRRLVGGMTEPNAASAALHLAHGFTPVGTFHAVGTKFGRAWDVTWFERAV
jgi:phosphinothricin acetyltransferase